MCVCVCVQGQFGCGGPVAARELPVVAKPTERGMFNSTSSCSLQHRDQPTAEFGRKVHTSALAWVHAHRDSRAEKKFFALLLELCGSCQVRQQFAAGANEPAELRATPRLLQQARTPAAHSWCDPTHHQAVPLLVSELSMTSCPCVPAGVPPLSDLLDSLEQSIQSRRKKNVEVLWTAAMVSMEMICQICRSEKVKAKHKRHMHAMQYAVQKFLCLFIPLSYGFKIFFFTRLYLSYSELFSF